MNINETGFNRNIFYIFIHGIVLDDMDYWIFSKYKFYMEKIIMNNNDIANDWWKNAKQRDMDRYETLYKDLEFKAESPILDIGGGAGTFLKYININDATIIDLAGEESLVGDYDFIKADITKKLPKLKKKFKTIFIMETLEHIKNPLHLMTQAYDNLEDDGVCYISVPYTPLDINRERQKNSFNCHVCRWRLKELIDQMEKLGFIVRVIQKRRRFKDMAFWLPHCWIVLKLKKRLWN